jgi:imidazolonepropionase-like amidohydrolase
VHPAIAARLPALQEHFRGLVASGANCFCSTDAGIGPAKPHDVMVHGVTQLVSLMGLPHDRAVAMSTSRPAAALGLSDQAGRLARGMPADLLVVSGRLDEDIEAILRPERVLHAGVVVRGPGQ